METTPDGYAINRKTTQEVFEKYKLPTRKTIGGFKYMMPNGAKCEIDHEFKRLLDKGVQGLGNAHDFVIAVTGMEGSGKSFGLAMTIATYISWAVNTPFNVSNIVFSHTELEQKINDAQPGECILFDEFILAGASGDAMSKIQKTLTKLFTLIRYKRLSIILVMPYFTMMSKYFAVARTRWLIDAYNERQIVRGHATVYGYSRKGYLYNVCKKLNTVPFNYFKEGTDLRIKFTDLGNTEITEVPVIDMNEYAQKKNRAVADLGQDDETKKPYYKKAEKYRKRWLRDLKLLEKYGYTISSLCRNKEIPEPDYSNIMKDMKSLENGEIVATGDN